MIDPVPEDDATSLKYILAKTKALLLDFDGPICSVFAGIPATFVATQLRQILADYGTIDLPPGTAETSDPFSVFRFAASIGDEEARHVETELSRYELQAVSHAIPTAGGHDVIRRWHDTGKKMAVVSNNSRAAVERYLELHDMRGLIDVIAARQSYDPELLKPNPFLVMEALDSLRIGGGETTLVGDSPSDIIAIHSAQGVGIGYGSRPGKVASLRSVQPEAVITQMETLAEAVAMIHSP